MLFNKPFLIAVLLFYLAVGFTVFHMRRVRSAPDYRMRKQLKEMRRDNAYPNLANDIFGEPSARPDSDDVKYIFLASGIKVRQDDMFLRYDRETSSLLLQYRERRLINYVDCSNYSWCLKCDRRSPLGNSDYCATCRIQPHAGFYFDEETWARARKKLRKTNGWRRATGR